MSISAFQYIARGDHPHIDHECMTIEDREFGVRAITIADRAIYDSPIGHANVMASFTKTPFDFKFYLLNVDSRVHSYPNVIAEYAGDYTNSIVVGYTHNITAQSVYLPFNAWVLAHRIGHLNMNYPASLSNQPIFFAIQKAMFTLNNDDCLALNMDEAVPHSCCLCGIGGTRLRMLFSCFLTMRSARNALIVGDLDVFAEMMAQYIISGKVSLLKARDIAQRLADYRESTDSTPHIVLLGDIDARPNQKFPYPDLLAVIDNMLKLNTLDEVQDVLGSLEDEINMHLHEFLQKMVGKISLF
jgi:hypothetical protein